MFEKNRLIGLTGGIGCGKSTVARVLESRGLVRIDTDQVARDVVRKETVGLGAVVDAFGEAVLTPDGELDRKALASVVFADEKKRKILESILHPLIWSAVIERVEEAFAHGSDVVVEVPLLFENARQEFFDSVWVVACEPDVQRERLKMRNNWDETEIEARIASQMPLQKKVEMADIVIWNNGSSEELESSIEEAWLREQA